MFSSNHCVLYFYHRNTEIVWRLFIDINTYVEPNVKKLKFYFTYEFHFQY